MDCLYITIPKWMNTEDGSGGHLYVGVWAPDCSLGVRRPGSALHATDSAQPRHTNDTAVVNARAGSWVKVLVEGRGG